MTRVQARRALRDLGRTKDEVAKSLAKAGIRGVPGNHRCCAVARYLVERGLERVTVNAGVVWRDGNGRRNEIAPVDIPVAVHRFVTAFDLREYPELIVEEA